MSKKTVQTIIESGNHYVIGVKKNQMNLYKYMEKKAEQRAHGSCSETILNRGRIERREIRSFALNEEFATKWFGAKQFIQVKRKVKKNGRTSTETAFYISSIEVSALLYNVGIRSHWGIENCLHWIKDVTLEEDKLKIYQGEAPSVLSTLRNGALNIFRKNGMHEIAKAIRLVSNDINQLCRMIT